MDVDFLTGQDALLQTMFASYAAEAGDRLWCTFEGTRHTYAEIDAASNQFAHALRDEVGVVKGDAVAVCMANCAEYFVAMFAIHRLGAVYVPCSTLYTEDELRYQLTHAEVRAVVTDPEMLELVTSSLPDDHGVRATIVVGKEAGAGSTTLQELLAGRPSSMPSEAAAVAADDMAMLMYTSGTTDRPKGVMFSQGNLTTAAHTAVKHFRWREDDRYLHYFPLFHANGGLYGVAPAIMVGASIAMVPKFSASTFGQMLVENDATFVPVNSTHVKMILRNPETEFDRVHGVRRMMLGLTLSPEDFTAFEERFNTRLMGTYGLTESLGINVIGEPIGPRKVASAGRVIRGYTLRVLGEDGEPVATGEPGELALRSHQRHGLAMGYFKDAAKTAEVFGDGWLRSGDVVRVDDDGYVWFVERKKDMIKRSGFNVAAAEVERVIRGIAGVLDVAVVGTPDAIREEAIVAYVVPDAPGAVTAEDIFAGCEAGMAEYKRPQFIELVDALPLNFLGKIERRVLRERALVYRIDSTERAPVGRRVASDVAGDPQEETRG
ncbi:MAG: carnitine-CoA ligase [Actinomycetota bacterium]|nr:carnitine-CoA ligase [Actinomycetota bacterium]